MIKPVSMNSFEYTEIKISGHGTYYVPESIAAAAAKMLQGAHEIACSLDANGTVVPVHLVGTGARVIAAIKFIRGLTNLNLKEAKRIVDKSRGACGHAQERILLGHYSWNEALRIKSEGADNDALIELPSALALLAQQAE